MSRLEMTEREPDIFDDVRLMEQFTEYYNERINERFEDVLDLEFLKYVVGKYYDDIGLPTYSKVAKKDKAKKRDVYYYNFERQIYIKYINYVMTRKFDLKVHKNCHSFQKGKSCKNIVRRIIKKDLKNLCAVKADISDYFNSIPVKDAEGNLNIDWWLPEDIKNNDRAYKLICNILNNDLVIYHNNVIEKPDKGVMAGMPFAGTLSNIYLKGFDEELSNRYPNYSRYSDDILILCKEEERDEAARFMREKIVEYGLLINETKTEIFDKGEAFDYLGLNISANRVDLGYMTKKKMKAKIKRKVRAVYRWGLKKGIKDHYALAKPVIRKFNTKFYGSKKDDFLDYKDIEIDDDSKSTDFTWSRYFFDIITTTDGLNEIDRYMQMSLRYLVKGRYCSADFRYMTHEELRKIGYVPLVNAYYRRKRKASVYEKYKDVNELSSMGVTYI